jgi:ribokinase
MSGTESHPTLFWIASYMHGFVIRAPRFPRDGETILGTDSEIGPGGKGSNQAIAAARLGAQVEVLACVGDDSFGAAARDLWEAEGLGTGLVRIDPALPTGMAFIMVDETGQNRIIVTPGANGALRGRDAAAAETGIAGADAVIAQFESPPDVVEGALAVARRHGVRTILNPAPARPVADSLLALVDVITPNEAESQELTGLTSEGFDPEEAAHALRRRGVRTVVLTLGERGAYVLDDRGGRHIPGVQVSVVDTTGAGDAFTGALAVALARGADIDEAVRFGNLGGAFCVTRPGVVPGLGAEADLLALRHTES